MECPYCYTNFEYHLSICPHCAKATDDPLYHELFASVKPRKVTEPAESKVAAEAIQEIPPAPPVLKEREKPMVTAQIRSKNTCNTLVDFPGKKPELPEWRLELQSRIKEIQDQRQQSAEVTTEAIPARRHAIGGTGLAMAMIETPAAPMNPLMEKALARIERSRLKNEGPAPQQRAYTSYQPSQPQSAPQLQPAPPPAPASHAVTPRRIVLSDEDPWGDNVPFIFSENETIEDRLPAIGQNFAEKLAKATELKNELMASEKFTTSKLRKPEYIHIGSFDEDNDSIDNPGMAALRESRQIEKNRPVPMEETIPAAGLDEEETEEIAPFVFRFNAGLFDFIISAFLSLILLSPFMLLGGNWFSLEGMFAFLATCSIVMFLYITAAVGLIGRTLGMGLFSLEMIDVEDNDYPTFQQAAVSASVYLVSLALGGIGFATMFWNSERRAVHDLVSGTIVVREV